MDNIREIMIAAERTRVIVISVTTTGLLGLSLSISWMMQSYWPIVMTLLFFVIGGGISGSNFDKAIAKFKKEEIND